MKLAAIFLSIVTPSIAFVPQVRTPWTAVRTFSSPPDSGGQTTGIQFYPGIFEPCIPNVKLTRARDGSNGIAYFEFDRPSMFDSKETAEEVVSKDAITAMRMLDEEGEISTTDISAKFVNGMPSALSVKYVMTSEESWDRFIRFMDSYAEASELGFAGGGGGGGEGSGGGGQAKPRAASV